MSHAQTSTVPLGVSGLLLAASLLGCGGYNHAPTAPEIDIEPAMPSTLDDLRMVILEHAEDEDGDELFYSTRWYQDGVLRDRVMGDVVPADRTSAGEYWIVELWATDGLLDSPVAEATVYVFNTAPVATVRLQPARPDTRDDLVARVETSDLDAHEVEVGFTWSVDGVPTTIEGDTVAGSETAKGQLWSVEALPYDGDSWGELAVAEVTIDNSQPGTPTVAFVPEQPQVGVDDLLCALQEPVSDPDDDELSYRVALSVDGASFEDTFDTELPGDTVPASATARGQRWECRVWADDGEVEGRAGRASVRL